MIAFMKCDEDGTTLAHSVCLSSAVTDTIVVHNTHVYVVVQYYQYIYIQIDIAVDGGVVFNLSDKRKSKEILETSRKICHANSIIVTHPI